MSKVTFIHTSDLHIDTKEEERIEVLKWILEKSKEDKAALIISGDLFNSEKAANDLVKETKDVFSAYQDVSIFIIPGNYDSNAYKEKYKYSNNVNLLTSSPFTEISYNGVKIIGVPFKDNSCLSDALYNIQYSGLSVLIVHGTFFDDSAQVIREEVKVKDERYFPVFEEDLADNNIVYVAMGHFHSNFKLINTCNKKVCYPGTPIPIADCELGQRNIAKVVIDTDSKEVDVTKCPVEIGNYNLKYYATLIPGREATALRYATKYLEDNINSRANVKIELNGFSAVNETLLNRDIESVKSRYENKFSKITIINGTVSREHLLNEHTFAKDFFCNLGNYDVDITIKNRAVELGVKAFDSALS